MQCQKSAPQVQKLNLTLLLWFCYLLNTLRRNSLRPSWTIWWKVLYVSRKTRIKNSLIEKVSAFSDCWSRLNCSWRHDMMPMEGEFKILNCAARKGRIAPGGWKMGRFRARPGINRPNVRYKAIFAKLQSINIEYSASNMVEQATSMATRSEKSPQKNIHHIFLERDGLCSK